MKQWIEKYGTHWNYLFNKHIVFKKYFELTSSRDNIKILLDKINFDTDQKEQIEIYLSNIVIELIKERKRLQKIGLWQKLHSILKKHQIN